MMYFQAVAVLLLFLSAILLIFIGRSFLPIFVNCWFCSSNTFVFFKRRNSWYCPKCKQYNGFDKNGDYNKIIPEQFSYANKCFTARTRIFLPQQSVCDNCNALQEYKVKALAAFQPVNPAMFEIEVERYEFMLEDMCRLCSQCEKMVSKVANQKLTNAFHEEQGEFMRRLKKPKLCERKWFWQNICHLVGFGLALFLSCAAYLPIDNKTFRIFASFDVANYITQVLNTVLYYKQYPTIAIIVILFIVASSNRRSLWDVCSAIIWTMVLLLSEKTYVPNLSHYLWKWKNVDVQTFLLQTAAVVHMFAVIMLKRRAVLKKVKLIKLPSNIYKSLMQSAYPEDYADTKS